MTKTQKATMYQKIEKHGNDLNRVFNTGLDAITLCKKLRRLELKANKIATALCLVVWPGTIQKRLSFY